MKTCKTCLEIKPENAFYKQSARGLLGLRGSCKVCDNAKKAQYRKENRDRLLNDKKQDYAKNRARYLANKRSYRQENKGPIRALNAARKQVIKLRTPPWLSKDDLWLIKEAYRLAAHRTELFGFQWDVDHIVPLQGGVVSGLHVPWNMQVIPAKDNMRKKNKFAVNLDGN